MDRESNVTVNRASSEDRRVVSEPASERYSEIGMCDSGYWLSTGQPWP